MRVARKLHEAGRSRHVLRDRSKPLVLFFAARSVNAVDVQTGLRTRKKDVARLSRCSRALY